MKKFARILLLPLLALILPTFFITPKVIYADELASYVTSCTAVPSNPKPSQEVTLKMTFDKPLTFSNSKIEVRNVTTGNKAAEFDYPQDDPISSLNIPLGGFTEPGTYNVEYRGRISGVTVCKLDAAFFIAGGSLDYPNVKLEDPKTITEEITTIPIIVISGLKPTYKYRLKLHNWKGDDIDADRTDGNNDGSQEWPANSSGQVAALSVCNNGQAHRDDCTEIFGNQTYTIDIIELSGVHAGTVSFTVDAEAGHGIGANPCTTGPTGKCETALGDLPINIKGLADKILQIGIGLAGGIALILIVIGAIRVLISGGSEQALNGGREMIIAAVAGLIFLVFTTLILEFIGLNILGGVPGI